MDGFGRWQVVNHGVTRSHSRHQPFYLKCQMFEDRSFVSVALRIIVGDVQYHDINLATAKMYEILGPIFLAFLIMIILLTSNR